MNDANPYQAPTAPLEFAPADGNCWRDGSQLVVLNGAHLPPVCVKCGAAARVPMPTKTFHWHHPALYLLLPVGLLFYAIVAALVRRHVEVTVGLCPRHAFERARAQLASVAGVAIGIVLLFVALARNSGAVATVGGVLLLVSLVFGLMRGRTMVATQINAAQARFKGCDEAFLSQLPQLPPSLPTAR